MGYRLLRYDDTSSCVRVVSAARGEGREERGEERSRKYLLLPAPLRLAVRKQLRQARGPFLAAVLVLGPLRPRPEVVRVDVRELQAVAHGRVLAPNALPHVGPALAAAHDALVVRRVDALAPHVVDDVAQPQRRRRPVDGVGDAQRRRVAVLLPLERAVDAQLVHGLVADLELGEGEGAGLRAREHGVRGESAAVHAGLVGLALVSVVECSVIDRGEVSGVGKAESRDQGEANHLRALRIVFFRNRNVDVTTKSLEMRNIAVATVFRCK